jgi:hypothetical protein
VTIYIERLNSYSRWDKELETYGGSIFINSFWISMLSKDDRNPVYLRFILENEPVGMLGGIEIKVNNGPAKQLFFYSGIALKNANASLMGLCKTALYEYAQKGGYQRISMRSYDDQSYIDARISHFRIRKRMEYVFYLDKDRKKLVECFDRDLRRRVRKAKSEGAVFKRSGSPALCKTLLSLIEETYNLRQSKGYGKYDFLYLPFFGLSEINEIVRQGNGAFYFVEKDHEIISMQLVIFYGKKAYSVLMGTSLAGYRAAAPSLLFYELVLSLKEKGYSYLNIGGVSRSGMQKGLNKFKESLGAELVTSAEEQTNFIAPPLSFLNPVLELKRLLRNLRVIPGRIRIPFIFLLDLVIQKRDQY